MSKYQVAKIQDKGLYIVYHESAVDPVKAYSVVFSYYGLKKDGCGLSKKQKTLGKYSTLGTALSVVCDCVRCGHAPA